MSATATHFSMALALAVTSSLRTISEAIRLLIFKPMQRDKRDVRGMRIVEGPDHHRLRMARSLAGLKIPAQGNHEHGQRSASRWRVKDSTCAGERSSSAPGTPVTERIYRLPRNYVR